ncbi:transporter substrate-binding domain-containing protein [Alkalimarinus coralli]|uniref:transporter substrate-binding domain-containing protein n=1 Tax=Alkalimarinus coralli TaxID=2935863 RepID=UPI00202B47C9|nr:transporter substrate-binding domain-containing protein [Alkalimarinus coralli]
MIFKTLLTVFCLLGLFAPSLNATEVSIAFSPHKPPYVIEDEGRGLEVDIVREALAVKGYTLKVDFFERAFLRNAIAYGRTDGAAGLVGADDGLYYSEPYIGFQNSIISRAEDKIKLSSLSDLRGRRFSAWKGAHKVLGEEYNLATEDGASPSYLEFDNQLIQNKMFWSHRIDLLVIDHFVFNWYRRALSEDFITTGEIANHPLLPEKTYYRIAFKDESIKEAFNHGLARLKRTGRYSELESHYFWGEQGALPSPIYLHYYDRPPYLNKGNNGVFGLAATAASDAFKASGIRFSWKQTPASKQLDILKENHGKDCLVGWLSNGHRQNYAKYTDPIYIDKPLIALTRKDNPIEAESLEELFNDSKKVMLVKEAYSYGHYVDRLVDQLKPRRLILAMDRSDLLHALDSRKADYLLIAPEDVDHALLSSGLQRSKFKTQKLKDVPEGDPRYILCSKKVSDDVISKLNKAIRRSNENDR